MKSKSAYLHLNEAHGDDDYLIRNLGSENTLDAVFDGVSTAKGKIASQFMSATLDKKVISNVGEVVSLFQKANRELYKKHEGSSLTTATAVLRLNNTLHCINTGDSPAYLFRKDKMYELTKMDRGFSNPAEITSAIGIGDRMELHGKSSEVYSGDRIALFTDGVSDNLELRDVWDVLKQKTPEESIRVLKGLLDYKKRNNIGTQIFSGRFKIDDATTVVRYFG